MNLPRALSLAVTCSLAPLALAAPPDLTIQLGRQNSGSGLIVSSGGDGANVPGTIDGAEVRRISGERSLYMYVGIASPDWRGPVDAYVIAEVFDDALTRVALQYDKAAETPNTATLYSASEQTLFLTGSGQWRRGVFQLPALRVGHGQNGRADFRLCGRNLAVRRITLTTARPADWQPDAPVDAAVLRSLAVTRAPGMELTYGNDASPADAAIFKALSVTSVESYVDWAGVEPEQGKWDWSRWDKQVATLRAANLKWVPFLIAGSAYATPLWFQCGPGSHFYRCLEHGSESKVQSLFNPALKPQVERFLHAFAERYRGAGIIESVLLGITGIYGESIYPAGPEGGWTTRLTGDYHNHAGWWAGDEHAIAAFRQAMRQRYGQINELNRAWGAAHPSFAQVSTFLPDRAPNDRARADLVEWYQQAMTDWSVFWVRTARREFPDTPIYLCTGGDGNPALGADFTAQTAAIAAAGAGVRITNEGSHYPANFSVTREVATATRLYGTYCGFEPASRVDSGGVVVRIYNATASGARQLHDYISNTLGSDAEALRNFRANAAWLIPRQPRIDAALYLSRESWALDPACGGRTLALSRMLRDVADIDFLTRRSVADGHLKRYRTLVLAEAPALEPAAVQAIEAWVTAGGTLVAASRTGEVLGGRLYDHAAWRDRLFAPPREAPALLVPVLDGEAPARWLLDIGSPASEPWLEGEWHGPETRQNWQGFPSAAVRWTGARPVLRLPVKPGEDCTLRIRASVPGVALGAAGIPIRVNGRQAGVLTQAGYRVSEFHLPKDLLPSPVARLEMAVQTWRPSERMPGSSDGRLLGVEIHQVELFRAGANSVPAGTASLRMAVDERALEEVTRPVGQGRTVDLRGLSDDPSVVARIFGHLLPTHPDRQLDGRFATQTDAGDLWLDTHSRPPRISVPPAR